MNKRELQQIAINHSSDINTGDFIEIYRKCTDKPYSFLVIYTTLSSNNLTGEDILPSNQQQIKEQTKFTYSPLGKAFDKQIKTIEDQGKKQVDALNTLKSNNNLKIKDKDMIPETAFANDESRKELHKTKETYI